MSGSTLAGVSSPIHDLANLRINIPSPPPYPLASPNPSPQTHQPTAYDRPPPTHVDDFPAPSTESDEAYPQSSDAPSPVPLDDEGLSTIEKIYLFSRSKATYHRVYISHALPALLDNISAQEAVDYVLPLLSVLAMDEDEQVREALVSELVRMIWWFYSHCRLVDEDEYQRYLDEAESSPTAHHIHMPAPSPESLASYNSPRQLQSGMNSPRLGDIGSPRLGARKSPSLHRASTPLPPSPLHLPSVISSHPPSPSSSPSLGQVPLISVQAFTPILGTLLLSPTAMVGGLARLAVVDLLQRMKNASTDRSGPARHRKRRRWKPGEQVDPSTWETHAVTSGEEPPWEVGLFRAPERFLLEKEIMWQIVIGLGQLDLSGEEEYEDADGVGQDYADEDLPSSHEDSVYDSYFPPQPVQRNTSDDVAPLSSENSPTVVRPQFTDFNPYFPSSTPFTPGSSSFFTPTSDFPSPAESWRTAPSSPAAFLHSPNSSYFPSTYDPSSSKIVRYGTFTGPPRLNRKQSSSQQSEYNPYFPAIPSETIETVNTDPVNDGNHSQPPSPVSTNSNGSVTITATVSSKASSPATPQQIVLNLTTPRKDGEEYFPEYTPSDKHTRLPDTSSPISSSANASPAGSVGSTSAGETLSPDSSVPAESPPQVSEDAAPGREGGTTTSIVSPQDTSPEVSLTAASPLEASESQEAEYDDEDFEQSQQAAVGRLSSMSLVAAVTASGCISPPIANAFIEEVERVASDHVYWVRRETCFALGALAKAELVPTHTVVNKLTPILRGLLHDSESHVRHSALFALPAILGRMGRGDEATRNLRRSLVLEIVFELVGDDSADVRGGLLETLGEIVYSFYDPPDEEGQRMPYPHEAPPDELIQLFFGKRIEDRRVRDVQQLKDSKDWRVPSVDHARQKAIDRTTATTSVATPTTQSPPYQYRQDKMGAVVEFLNDPARPLIIAFNFPAMTLALGKDQWEYRLRSAYMELAISKDLSIRRTLSASIGAMAGILGPEVATRDLLDVWLRFLSDALKSKEGPEDDVQSKMADGIESWISNVSMAGKAKSVNALLEYWEKGKWGGWKERERIALQLGRVVTSVASAETNPDVLLSLSRLVGIVNCVLSDSVHAVKEAGINSLPIIHTALAGHVSALAELRKVILTFATASTFKKRMTFVACQQSLIEPELVDGAPRVHINDPAFWETLREVASDPVVNVRIAVARLAGNVCLLGSNGASELPPLFLEIVGMLKNDTSSEVRSYLPVDSAGDHTSLRTATMTISPSASSSSTIVQSQMLSGLKFSRPPPVVSRESDEHPSLTKKVSADTEESSRGSGQSHAGNLSSFSR